MITIPRGNSLTLTIDICTSDGAPYSAAEGDTLIFTVKKFDGAPKLISKTIPMTSGASEVLLELEPSDTIDFKNGDYKFDVGLYSAGDFYTVILCDIFRVLPALSDMEDVT